MTIKELYDELLFELELGHENYPIHLLYKISPGAYSPIELFRVSPLLFTGTYSFNLMAKGEITVVKDPFQKLDSIELNNLSNLKNPE